MIKSSSKYNLHPLMKSVAGNKILDYRLRTRLIDENNIPQYFNKISFPELNLVFNKITYNLSKQIRAYVQAIK